MNYIFENLKTDDYYLILIWVIGCYIIFGSLILMTLQHKTVEFKRNDRNLLIVLVVFIAFFCGTRGQNIGTDTYNYYNYFYLKGLHIDNIFVFFKRLNTDFLFTIIMYVVFPFKSFTLFLLTVSLIMNISLYGFVRKFTNNSSLGSSLLLFLIMTCSLVFLNYELNTIRNGLAIPFILFGIFNTIQKEYKNAFLYFVIAFLFHRTSLIPIACILLVLLSEKVKYKYFIIFYVLAIGLAYMGFGFDKLSFLASIGNDDIQKLVFQGETSYRTGFRIDFVMYNSLFLFLFIKFSNLKNRTDLLLIKYYIVASVVFFFNFNIPFSDRIGGYSWVIIPLLLFNTINTSFPRKKLSILTWVTIFYFALNYIILPLLSGGNDTQNHH
ncbi:EpsG family protein [Thalassobellus suaedae]|uniref:EpsG family protein n=1 Tax=Thalassobellus suaedae TaxID=3074124 RepID=A0ABY9Y298_9FLAO|nr:EpsG family protein [Flavobacteriaceae bacterium HL-DH10]